MNDRICLLASCADQADDALVADAVFQEADQPSWLTESVL
jgi:hypothetical protein